ncbi:MAG TPA: valine--tRNA ligase [Candidatus Thermoplasmatota archaeon]|jgi:valyl-tRNA synthetase|nr:valine--tRNA ligase [Candidatus Thermoplasmatota archaeon]
MSADSAASSQRPEPRLPEKSWTVEAELKVFAELRSKTYEPTFASVRDDERCFVIDTPPPYPSGKWHIGAVAHYSLIDVIARSQRMLGQRVLFPWGLDRNGINIELVVEKKHNRKMDTFPRAEFLELCAKEIEGYSQGLVDIALRVGMSCDFAHAYRTDAPEFRALTQRTFIELWHKGKVVQELRPNNYCPDCRTTIADAEVLREERPGKLITVTWQVEGGQPLPIATTRPELIPACQAVLVHPDDDRYRGLHAQGKVRVLLPAPFGGRSVPLLADAGVDPAFGTGAMMVCSYGDFSDVERFRKFSLEPIAALGPDGKMTAAAGPLAGEHVKKARAKAVELLQQAGNVLEVKDIQQQVPICERSKTPIEIISLKEWYVRQVDVAADLRRIADGLDVHPAKHRQILLDWIDTVTIDWPVSRRRYYHTEIPIWYCKACAEAHVPHPGPYYQPWRQPAPPEIAQRGCTQCGAKEFVGEEKVFDTWMDSSGSNLWVTHYHDRPTFWRANFPCAIRPQGRDIVRTWLHYTLLKSYQLLGEPGFRHVWITGLGMDEQGRKMSKSLGNVIDPDEILREHGADAFRFWAASESTIGDDFRISRDRIAGARKFLTKLHNVARFISSFPAPTKPAVLDPVDQWILAELNRVIEAGTAAYAAFDFFTPSTQLRAFVWNTFAPHYVEMAKKRAYQGDPSAQWTLHEVLRACLLLLAPVSPFITHHLYQQLYGGEVHAARFPTPSAGVDASLVAKTPLVEAFNSDVWKRKKEQGLSLNQPIQGVDVPVELAPFKDALVAMHQLG